MAHELTKQGKSCLVIDRRDHIAGNIYCENIEGINVHKYGAHIFHTSNKEVWDYINQFAEFNNYINSPIAVYEDELYNLPFNMNTFSKMWNIRTPQEAKAMIEKQVAESGITEPANLEEQALSLGGRDVYEKLIKGYTEKQWGRDLSLIHISKHTIIQRIHATLPAGVTAPATTSPVSAFNAVPLDANPKLWHRAAPKNRPRTVTAESEEPCPARINWRSGHPPANTAANPTAYMPRMFHR